MREDARPASATHERRHDTHSLAIRRRGVLVTQFKIDSYAKYRRVAAISIAHRRRTNIHGHATCHGEPHDARSKKRQIVG
ncbi:protein of unknown function [Burkholderia multivorans]